MTGEQQPNGAGPAAQSARGDWGVMAATTSFHGIILTGSVVIMLLSFLLKVNDSNQVLVPGVSTPMPDSCLTKMYWGIDCPGCGMSRAFICISAGHFGKARQLNRGSFLIYLFIAIQIPWHAMQLLRVGWGIGAIDTWWTIVPALAVIVILVVSWIWRG